MKNGAALLLIGFLCLPAFARKKEKLAFTHSGEVVAHAATARFLLDGRDDLFYSGDYVCLPGDEHHAPDCARYADWMVDDKFAYIEVHLDDSSTIIICFHPENLQREAWNHDATVTTIRDENLHNDLVLLALRWEGAPNGEPASFHYAIDDDGRIWIKKREPVRPELIR